MLLPTLKLCKQDNRKICTCIEETEDQTDNDRSKETNTVQMSWKDFGNLFDWSKMGKDKKKPLLALLYKYSHVFTMDNYDLGFLQCRRIWDQYWK